MSPFPALKSLTADERQHFDLDCGRFTVTAFGVDLKNTLCTAANGAALVSGLNGDLNDPAVFSDVLATLEHVGRIDAVVCDLHPDLHSVRLAEELAGRLGVPLLSVQHHHAHIAAVMVEHGLERAVGLALDGFGYGTDGTAWGGECLVVDGAGFERTAHLARVAMPGGDAASREPWRMAVAWLEDSKLSKQLFPDRPVATLQQLCRSPSTPQTSSAGRIFDAASAIVLGREVQAFEGEAAMLLERSAAEASAAVEIDRGPARMIRQLAEAVVAGGDRASLALGFHHALADHFATMAMNAASEHDIESVVLAGGCFMNRLLREKITSSLKLAGVKVYTGVRLQHGDGAVALGQAWVALEMMKRGAA